MILLLCCFIVLYINNIITTIIIIYVINIFVLIFIKKIYKLIIKIKSIMRQYQILTGKNAGAHFIYDDIREARTELNQQIEYLTWREGRTGDWVATDDGYFVQILNIYELSQYGGKDKPRYTESKSQGKYAGHWVGSKAVKVCFGVFTIYGKKNGDVVSNKMIAQPFRMEDFHKNRQSITAHNTILGKYLTKKKKMFVYHYYTLGNPVAALKLVLPKNAPYLSKKHLLYKALELIKDVYVTKELNTYMDTPQTKETFRARLLKSLTDEGLGIDNFVKELKEGLQTTKKGSMAHRQWVEMYGKIVSSAEEQTTELIPDKLPQAGKQQEVAYETPILLPPTTN